MHNVIACSLWWRTFCFVCYLFLVIRMPFLLSVVSYVSFGMLHSTRTNFLSLIQVKYYYNQPHAQYHIHITVLLYIHNIVHLVRCNKRMYWSEMFRVNDTKTLIQVLSAFLESWFILHNFCVYTVFVFCSSRFDAGLYWAAFMHWYRTQ
jgi:hypothetical protein